MCKGCTRRSAAATNASVSPFRFGINSLSNRIAWAVNTFPTFCAEGLGPLIIHLQKLESSFVLRLGFDAYCIELLYEVRILQLPTKGCPSLRSISHPRDLLFC